MRIWELPTHLYPARRSDVAKISLEALFASLFIDAHEGRAVHKFAVTGSYLNASLPDDKVVHMKSENKFVDMMSDLNPEYKN